MWNRASGPASWALIFALALIFATMPVEAQSPRIKLGTIAPRGSAYHQVLIDMGENWRRAETPGASFIVFTDGSQGGEADIVRRMRIGQLNAALVSVIGLAEIDASAGALQKMPLMFRSWEEVDAAGQRVRPLLEKRFLDKGFVVLFWAEAGWVRFFSREPALRPADFKRLKMFAWAGDPEQINLMKAMGYQPVVLETADILPGLQTGLINTVPVTAAWALATQIDGAATHMLDIRWAPVVGAAVVTRSAWETLSPAGKEAMRQSAAKAAEQLRSQRASNDAAAVAAMQKRGLHVHALPPEVQAEWRQLAESVYPRIRGAMVPADAFDAVQGALADYRGTTSAGASR
jgi:TRAP-type C4-dicarboxylate transport system substrate-binding protein